MSEWQSAFVTTTVALGDSLDDARASLSEDDWTAAAAATKVLASTRRETRAKGLASGLARIVLALEEMKVL